MFAWAIHLCRQPIGFHGVFIIRLFVFSNAWNWFFILPWKKKSINSQQLTPIILLFKPKHCVAKICGDSCVHVAILFPLGRSSENKIVCCTLFYSQKWTETKHYFECNAILLRTRTRIFFCNEISTQRAKNCCFILFRHLIIIVRRSKMPLKTIWFHFACASPLWILEENCFKQRWSNTATVLWFSRLSDMFKWLIKLKFFF